MQDYKFERKCQRNRADWEKSIKETKGHIGHSATEEEEEEEKEEEQGGGGGGEEEEEEEELLITSNVSDECSNVQNIDHLSAFEQILEPPLSAAYASVDS
jgi:hypothetical protein